MITETAGPNEEVSTLKCPGGRPTGTTLRPLVEGTMVEEEVKMMGDASLGKA